MLISVVLILDSWLEFDANRKSSYTIARLEFDSNLDSSYTSQVRI